MSKPPKIKLEKKVFKIGNNETFLLEYPSNYEEIANKKLYNLQKDYESTSNSNNDRNKIKINNEIFLIIMGIMKKMKKIIIKKKMKQKIIQIIQI